MNPKTEEEITRPADEEAPFAALVFKVMSDPFVGKLTYFRVYSGRIKAGDRVLNTTNGKTERIGRILQMHANHREEREDLVAGEIAAAVGIKQSTTGDTLAAEGAPIVLESMTFPDPVISVAIEPKTKGDQDKLSQGLQRLAEEDPTFRVSSDEETAQTLIAGMGELHLEIIVDRLMREFKVDANVGRPQVAYRETAGQQVDNVRGKFIRQTGGSGQYGDVVINLIPQTPGTGTSSSTRSSAARSRRSTSSPSTRASRRRWAQASSPAIPSSTSRSSSSRAPTTTSTRASAHSRSPARWRSRRRSGARSPSCSSRPWRSRSSPPRTTSAM